VIDRRYSLDEIAEAHHAEAGHRKGHVVVRLEQVSRQVVRLSVDSRPPDSNALRIVFWTLASGGRDSTNKPHYSSSSSFRIPAANHAPPVLRIRSTGLGHSDGAGFSASSI